MPQGGGGAHRPGTRRPGAHRPGTRRRFLAACGAAGGLAALTAALVLSGVGLSLAGIVLIYLTAVVLVAATCGVRLALASAVASDVLVNYYFVRPFHTLSVDSQDSFITLAVYVVVAATVSVAVDLAARQRAAAARSGLEAALLARITQTPLEERSLSAVLEHVRDTFGMTGAALLESSEDGEQPVAVVGHAPSAQPVLSVSAGERLRLVADGPPVIAADQRFLTLLATAAARALQAERLAAEAAQARELAEIDKLRAGLLAAVGHDLRTPLAGIKACISSLCEPELSLTEAQQAELLATVNASADKMNALVENLLALSRLQVGALSVHPRPTTLDEVVAAALLHTSVPEEHHLDVHVPDDLPAVWADPGLLERVVANLVDNALHASPDGRPVHLHACQEQDGLRLRIIDHGPGIPAADRERVFAPFQRLHDRTTDHGLGLGLAIARGFTEAMGGSLAPTETPGGGLTMTLTLPAAP